MDYKKTAQEILNHVGGVPSSFQRHIVRPDCAWFLQITRRQTKIALEKCGGFKGVFEASGQLQIILGTGTVDKVLISLLNAGVTASSKAEAKEAAVREDRTGLCGQSSFWEIFFFVDTILPLWQVDF